MKLVNIGSFDGLQQALVTELLMRIKRELELVEAPDDMVRELTESIGFSVAGLIDGTSSFESGGKVVEPMLTFMVAEGQLEFAGGNSWMHEYVHRLVPRIFGDDSES
jgi:hypothetical protein